MKKIFLIIICISSLPFIGFGQNNRFKKISKIEMNLITDLLATINETSLSFVISPFICYSADTNFIGVPELARKYQFCLNQFDCKSKDTTLIFTNTKLKVANPDSLINHKSLDTTGSFHNPVLDFIYSTYFKSGLCSFSHIIFSKKKKYAIAEYWIDCGFLCGRGETVLMKKTKGKWIKLETLQVTES